MMGRARARCGVSVVNALATGKGAAFAIDLFVEATVVVRDDRRDIDVKIEPEADEDPMLAREVVRRVFDKVGLAALGANVYTQSDVPASMGLKSSSAAANAIAAAANAAAHRYDGEALPLRDLEALAIDAAFAAKVTVTGAYDDALASSRGGLCVTDNRERTLLARHEAPPLLAVVVLPGGKRRKDAAARVDYAAIAPAVRIAHDLALRGAWAEALTINGLAYGSVYGVDFAIHRAAIAAGARAVGVSGTGPAVAAVCEPTDAKEVEAALAPFGRVLSAPLSNAAMEVLA